MKKWSVLTIVAALTVGYTACSNEDNQLEEQQNFSTFTYKVSIPANFGGAETRAVEEGTGSKEGYLISTFRTEDDICVYNTTKSYQKSSVNLKPNASGASVNLIGDITFTTAPSIGDILLLSYTNNTNDKFDYQNQQGTLSGLSSYDYATAEVAITSISGDVITTEPAHFENAQSMYKFTFSGLPTGIWVKSVVISSARENLYYYDDIKVYGFSWEKQSWINPVSITLNDAARLANGAGVVYAALRFKPIDASATDNITFTVTGTDNRNYTVIKSSPLGGFQNSKYYKSTIALQLQLPSTEYALCGWAPNASAINPQEGTPVLITSNTFTTIEGENFFTWFAIPASMNLSSAVNTRFAGDDITDSDPNFHQLDNVIINTIEYKVYYYEFLGIPGDNTYEVTL